VPVHQLGDVLEADVAVLQLGGAQGAHPAAALDAVPFEREVHLFHSVTLGRLAERRLGGAQAAAVQDAISWVQRAAR
jgi:hypothetical protein